MAIAYVSGSSAHQDFASSASARTLQWAANNGAGNLLIAAITTYNGSHTVTVSDGTNGSYTQAGGYSTAPVGGGRVSIWYIANCAGSVQPTVTVTPDSASFVTIALHEFSGVATSTPLDATNPHNGSTTTTPTTGTCTAAAGELVFAAFQSGNNPGVGTTVASPFTILLDSANPGSGPLVAAYDVNAAGSEGATWTCNTTGNYAALAASFKPAGAAGGLFRTGLSIADVGGGGPFFGNPIGYREHGLRRAFDLPRRKRRRFLREEQQWRRTGLRPGRIRAACPRRYGSW